MNTRRERMVDVKDWGWTYRRFSTTYQVPRNWVLIVKNRNGLFLMTYGSYGKI